MNILNIENISKIYGEKVIFDEVSYSIHERDKIGIIGINGTGKTTLLNMIAGIEEPDKGNIVTKNGLKIAYLPQSPKFPPGACVLSSVIQEKGPEDWNIESEAKTMLNKLGVTDHTALMEHLSGGQKKRVALAQALIHPFDLLILDEPTNHLDNEMITWLEEYLNKYNGSIIMVTHDRYFLDRVSNRILEISHGKFYSYDANYSDFLELKVQREEMELASERKRQSVLRMEMEWAKRGCRARSTKQRARLERLEALKNGASPLKEQSVEMESLETRMGKKTVELHHVSKSYGDKKLIDDFNYIILKNQRLGIIGPNGCGKSTLLKIMAGLIQPDTGSVEVGETIKIAYMAQEMPELDSGQRVIDYVKNIAEYIATKEGRISASQMLERFLFTPDMQYTQIGKLSGGEKKRLYLLGLLASPANIYFFDEANNDIDIPTMTILEDFLNSFPGIVVTISHDRYFLDNVVDRIFAFEGEGKLRQYDGAYTDYLETKKAEDEDKEEIPDRKTAKDKKVSEKDWKKNKPVKLKFSYKEQKEYETIDEDIALLEKNIEKLEEDMMENATNSVKLGQIAEKKVQTEEELEAKMERWVYLNDLAEKIEAQDNSQ